MNVVMVFITNSQTPVLMQAEKNPLNHPAGFPKATVMRSFALGELRCDLLCNQKVQYQLRVISPVTLNTLGLTLQ